VEGHSEQLKPAELDGEHNINHDNEGDDEAKAPELVREAEVHPGTTKLQLVTWVFMSLLVDGPRVSAHASSI
jgi:hypothetical protein